MKTLNEQVFCNGNINYFMNLNCIHLPLYHDNVWACLKINLTCGGHSMSVAENLRCHNA